LKNEYRNFFQKWNGLNISKKSQILQISMDF